MTLEQSLALNILIGLIILAIVYIILNSFCIWEALLAIIITTIISYAQPKLFERLESQPSIQYYCIIAISTVLFSVELCKQDTKLILGLLFSACILIISLYVGNRIVVCLSLFFNLYILITTITSLIKPNTDANWNGISC